jgi:hypothetical protein
VFDTVRFAVRWLLGTVPAREFGRPDAPDWFVRMNVSHLPHGGSRCITFIVARGMTTLEIRSGFWLWLRWASAERAELGPEESARFTALLEQAVSEPRLRPSFFGFDGSPFTLTAYKREPFQILRLRGNLMGGFRSVGVASTTMALVELARVLGYGDYCRTNS